MLLCDNLDTEAEAWYTGIVIEDRNPNREAEEMIWSCSCDDDETCGPHHTDPDSPFCPNRAEIQTTDGSYTNLCRACAKSQGIPASNQGPAPA